MKNYAFPALIIGLATACAGPASLAQGYATPGEHSASSAVLAAEKTDTSEMKDLKHIRASKLLSINVSSKDGDNLGQVQDLVFNADTGEIKFALVGQGFMAGLGQKMVPVPWQAVSVHSEREFALNVDKRKLESAPNWSQMEVDEPDYIIRIYRFFEMEPQSEVGGLGSSSSESGRASGSSSDADSDTHDDSSADQVIKDQPAQPESESSETPD